ncbi:putative membrane protein [Allochromatium warmingii]|uniref:Putative membrane protein n=1 Tax=Allochromatium warmingii TaxID=61595 RepID=A0A1H3FGI2_ALLWA|nr:DUF350 domain-containing protein [Allochromatium warmingii]SDX89975.1 putative membrane protein [Allochromatium warmingii]
MLETLALLWETLTSGLPILLLHFFITLALLVLGIVIYALITPFRERELIKQSNAAAGLTLGGAWIALAIPLAATLATSGVWLDIVLWGSVAVLMQLLTFGVFTLLFRDLRTAIESGNVAAAALLVGVQVAVALLNAGAMVG